MTRLGGPFRALVSSGVWQSPVTQGPYSLAAELRPSLEHHTSGLPISTLLSGPRCMQPSQTRYLAAASDDKKEEAESSSSSASGASTSERRSFIASLKDLLKASTQRIAKGDVGSLAQVPSDLAATAREAQEATAAAATSSSDQLETDQRLAVLTAERPTETLAAGATATAAAVAADASAVTDSTPSAASSAAPSAAQRLLHPKYGYAELGGVLPKADVGSVGAAAGGAAAGGGVAALVGLITSQAPRVHPRKRFLPGETYDPQDLNPFAVRSDNTRRRPVAVPRPTAEEVMQKADFKNVAFLSRWFLSPAGRLLPRSQTRLPVTVHRHVCRQIKLARHLGLMAGETRLDKQHLPRLREQELKEAMQGAAEGAGGVAGARMAVTGGRLAYNELLDFGS